MPEIATLEITNENPLIATLEIQAVIETGGGGGGGSTNLGVTRTATAVTVTSDTGNDATLAAADSSLAGVMTAAMFTKLDDIATGATANSADATLLARANHTGTQAISTVTGLQTALDAKAASTHTHSADAITSGTLALARLPTTSGGGAALDSGYVPAFGAGGQLAATQTFTLWQSALVGSSAISAENLTGNRTHYLPDSNGTLALREDVKPVSTGGTGLSSATAYAVLCGGTTGTGALQSVCGVGTSGQVLTSNGAGALPTFQTVSGGALSGTGGVDNAILRADGTGGATLQNSDIVISDAATATANSVCIENAHAGQTNSSICVVPKGTGAFSLGPKPDGTTTGGNARGTYAVDLQMTRTSAASRVASGTNAFLGGGTNNSATNSNSAVAGGSGNQSTGSSSFVGGSVISTASGTTSAALASNGSTASATTAVVIAGDTGTASAVGAVAFGNYPVANRQFQQTQAAGRFAANGDAQVSRLVLRRSTTDATQTEMTIDGAAASGTTITTSNRVILNANSTMMVMARIVARSTSGTDNACYERRCLIKRDGANNTVLVGSVQTIGTDIESSAGWDVTIDADDTNESVRVLVTGAAATTIRWVCTLELVEVSLA